MSNPTGKNQYSHGKSVLQSQYKSASKKKKAAMDRNIRLNTQRSGYANAIYQARMKARG